MPPASTSCRSIIPVVFAAAALFATAPPAGAWLRDFESRTSSTPLDERYTKSVSVGCPGGKHAIGMGASAGRGIVQVALNKIWVFITGSAKFGPVLAAATKTDYDRLDWSLATSAFCVAQTDERPTLGTGARYVKDVTIVRSRSRSDSDHGKGVSASCPAGSTAIGGGFQIVGSEQVAGDRVDHPFRGGRDGIEAHGHETDATTESWAIGADAICANITTAVSTPTYAGGATRVVFSPGRAPVESVPLSGSETFSRVNSGNKTVTAHCPATRFVVGGGASVRAVGTGDRPAPRDVAITMSRPGGVGATSNTWIARAVEVDPITASWQLRARVVCAKLNGLPAP